MCGDLFGCSCTFDLMYTTVSYCILYKIQCTMYIPTGCICVRNLSCPLWSNLHHIRLGKSVLSTHTYSLSHWPINFIVWMISSDQMQRVARIIVSSLFRVYANITLMISVNGLKFQSVLLFLFLLRSEEWGNPAILSCGLQCSRIFGRSCIAIAERRVL